MEQEKLNSKLCAQCGKMMYSQGNIIRQICDDCRKENQREYNKKLKKFVAKTVCDSNAEPQPLSEVIYEVEDYNKAHHTCLTYGQYISKRFLGQL